MLNNEYLLQVSNSHIQYPPYVVLRRLRNLNDFLKNRLCSCKGSDVGQRCPPCTDFEHLPGLISRLESISIITNTHSEALLREGRSLLSCVGTREDLYSQYSVKPVQARPMSRIMRRYFEILGERRASICKSRMVSRIMLELEHARREGWFVVFNTLTVNPEHYHAVFASGSDHWRTYVRQVDRAVAIRAYGSVRNAKGHSGVHRYCAVVESGSRSGRLHIHVLHFMKVLPEGCFDPNRSSGRPDRREITGFRRFWPWGFSSPRPCRLGAGDAFDREKWKWPVVNGQIQKPSMSAAARYIAKYVTKVYTTSNTRHRYCWRTRVSRGFGVNVLQEELEQCPKEEVWQVVNNPQIFRREIDHVRISSSIVRSAALRVVLDYTQWKSLVGLPRAQTLIERLRILTRGRPDRKLMSSGGFGILMSSKTGVSKGLLARIREEYDIAPRKAKAFEPSRRVGIGARAAGRGVFQGC